MTVCAAARSGRRSDVAAWQDHTVDVRQHQEGECE